MKNKVTKNKVTLITVSMNRHKNIILNLFNWLKFDEINEIIIIDWCSDSELNNEIPNIISNSEEFKKVKIIKVRNYNKWILSYAFNFGFYFCKNEIILKLDADICISDNFFKKNILKENEYLHGTWRDTASFNGQFMCFKKDLYNVNLFNQHILTYGYDDTDLYNKLNRICTEKNLDKTTLNHIDNDNSIKYQNANNKVVEIIYNREICKKYDHINFDIKDYKKINNNLYHFIKKIPENIPRDNILYRKSIIEYLCARAKVISWKKANSMNNNELNNLLTNVSKSELQLKPNKKYLFCKPYNGIGNRLRFINSCLNFALQNDFIFVLIWKACEGFEYVDFKSLFNLDIDFEIINKDPKINFDYCTLTSPKGQFFENKDCNKYYSSLLTNKNCDFKNAKNICIIGAISFYTIKFNDRTVKFKNDNIIYKSLKPSKYIKGGIEYYKKKLNIDYFCDYKSCHIRRGDALNRRYKNNYLISSIYEFSKVINNEFEKNGRKFIVFSDDPKYCEKFFSILCNGKYIIFSKDEFSVNVSNFKVNIITSIIELFCMSNTKEIFGTNWSTFSSSANLIGPPTKLITIKDSNKYGLFKYDNSINIGDTIQSIALRQYLPFVNSYINRDSLNEVNESTNIIMAGWFCHTKNCLKETNGKLYYCTCKNCVYQDINWPPSKKVNPLFFSFNVSNDKLLENPENISYLKKYEPIGCRDFGTVEKLNKYGIDNYFSGCLTLNLKPKGLQKEDFILVVDSKVPDEYKNEKIIKFSNTITYNQLISKSDDEIFEIAEDVLDKIEKAKLVITSRLHIMAPALAFGTKVIFKPEHKAGGDVSKHNNPSFSSNRYKGIEEFINEPKKLEEFKRDQEEKIIKYIYEKYY